MYKTSQIFWPVVTTPKNVTVKNTEIISRSQKLMVELGLVKPAYHGTYQIMPIAQRAMDKCAELIQHYMRKIGGQKLSLPVLTSSNLWRRSGRLDGDIGEFYMLHDRHGKEFLLSPTHEEAITSMLATAAPISYRQLPLRLYQLGPKFRDELKARFGLIRAKEFYMKDLYTFDRGNNEALLTYEQVIGAYIEFFEALGVPFVKVEASSGMMGGNISHEFHYLADMGEDHLLRCLDCDYASNVEVSGGINSCPKCASGQLKEVRGIEVAHAFVLGDKYSKPLDATYLCEKGKPSALIMGCYGVGISRLVAASLEALSTETDLRWPKLLAPFEVCIIGPKQGSKEQRKGDIVEGNLCKSIADIVGVDEILHDDRKNLTIGKRLKDAKRMGHPFVIVVGSKAVTDTPKVELHTFDNQIELEIGEVLNEIERCRTTKI